MVHRLNEWLVFEKTVAEHYRMLGYSVQHDVELSGQQIDLLITKHVPGLGLVNIIVDCKYSKSKISNQEVQNFISTFTALRQIEPINAGVLVSNARFTRQAKAIAEKSKDIFLIEQQVLLAQTVVLDQPQKIIDEYENSSIFKTYIPQKAFGRLPTIATHGLISDLAEVLGRWGSLSKGGACFVLGDYGSGKTTLLHRLRYLQLKENWPLVSSRIPVIFLLKNFYKFDSLDEFVVQTLQENYRLTIDRAWFWAEVDKSSFFLLLDGFDELSIETNVKIRQMLFARLSPLIFNECPTVVSCRPTYFVEPDEFERLTTLHFSRTLGVDETLARSKRAAAATAKMKAAELRARVLHKYSKAEGMRRELRFVSSKIEILEFDKKQIIAYLKKYEKRFVVELGGSVEEVASFLKRVYDLSDLMKRPILLEMVVETLLSGALKIDDEEHNLGASTLYEIYTDGKLTMEAGKGWTRQLLSIPERKEFAQLVAFTIFMEGSLDIKFRQIRLLAKQYGSLSDHVFSSINDEIAQEAVANDIALCGFLITEGKSFRFSHKSFFEFFVSRKIFNDIVFLGSSELITLRELPREILYFLGDLLRYNDECFLIVLQACRSAVALNKKTNKDEIHNLIRMLAFSNRSIHEIKGDSLALFDASCKDVEFSAFALKAFSIDRLNAVEISIQGSSIEDIYFCDCSAISLRIERSKLGIRRLDSAIQSIIVRESSVKLGIGGKIIQSLDCWKVNLQFRVGSGASNGRLFEAAISSFGEEGDFVGFESELRFENCEFDRCKIFGSNGAVNVLRIEDCKFIDCDFRGIWLSGKDAVMLCGGSANAKPIIMRSTGVIFVRNKGRLTDPPDRILPLLQKFDEGGPLKQIERQYVDYHLNNNVIALNEGKLIIVNGFYARHLSKFRQAVFEDFGVNIDELCNLIR